MTKIILTLKYICSKINSTFSPTSDIPTLISDDELSDSTRPDFRRPLVGVRGGGVAGVSQGQTSSEVDVPGTMFGFLTLFNNINTSSSKLSTSSQSYTKNRLSQRYKTNTRGDSRTPKLKKKSKELNFND